jgi:hypothetical protein
MIVFHDPLRTQPFSLFLLFGWNFSFGFLREDWDCVFGFGGEDICVLEYGMMLPVDATLCHC